MLRNSGGRDRSEKGEMKTWRKERLVREGEMEGGAKRGLWIIAKLLQPAY